MDSLQSHFSHIAPRLTTHLTDREANPIFSTHPDPLSASRSLVSLSSAFVQSYETASRMGLGTPLRVTISTAKSDIVVIQTAPTLNNQHSDPSASTMTNMTASFQPPQSAVSPIQDHESVSDTSNMLVGTVIAPADQLADARVAIWGVEAIARKLQDGLEK